MSKKQKNVSISSLRAKAKAAGVTQWKTLNREDLEFFIKEFSKHKELDKLHTAVTATGQG